MKVDTVVITGKYFSHLSKLQSGGVIETTSLLPTTEGHTICFQVRHNTKMQTHTPNVV